MKIEFKKVDRNFNEVKAVSRVTLEITPTTFVALVGPSGAGKSTLLKMINGLQTPDAGIILLDDEDVALKPKAMLRRRIGYVFQSIGLFPHLTVSENIAIGPRLQKERVSEERMSELLQLLELEPGIGIACPTSFPEANNKGWVLLERLRTNLNCFSWMNLLEPLIQLPALL